MTQDNATLVERIELDPTLVIFRIRPDVIPPSGEPATASPPAMKR